MASLDDNVDDLVDYDENEDNVEVKDSKTEVKKGSYAGIPPPALRLVAAPQETKALMRAVVEYC